MPIDIEKIKRLREKVGLTMGQAATKAGFASRQQWYQVESGRRENMTVQTLEKVASVLGCRAKDLLK